VRQKGAHLALDALWLGEEHEMASARQLDDGAPATVRLQNAVTAAGDAVSAPVGCGMRPAGGWTARSAARRAGP